MSRLGIVWEAEEYVSACGYCLGQNCSYQYGMWTEVLPVAAYEELIAHGWRRSGRYLYKPVPKKTCCPTYSIRLDVEKFIASKSQRKTQRKLANLLSKGCSYEDLAQRGRGSATQLASHPDNASTQQQTDSKRQQSSAPGISIEALKQHQQPELVAGDESVAHAGQAARKGQDGAGPETQKHPGKQPSVDPATQRMLVQILQEQLQGLFSTGLLPNSDYSAPKLSFPTRKLLAQLGKSCRMLTAWPCQLAAAACKAARDGQTDVHIAPSHQPAPPMAEPPAPSIAGSGGRKDIPELAAVLCAALVPMVNACLATREQQCSSSATGQPHGAELAQWQARVGQQGQLEFHLLADMCNRDNDNSLSNPAGMNRSKTPVKSSLKRAFECLAMHTDGKALDADMADVAILPTMACAACEPVKQTPAQPACQPSHTKLATSRQAQMPRQAFKINGCSAAVTAMKVDIEVDGSLQRAPSRSGALRPEQGPFPAGLSGSEEQPCTGPRLTCCAGSEPVNIIAASKPVLHGVARGAASGPGVPAAGVNRWEVRTVPSVPELVAEEFPLYRKYQIKQHGDSPDEVTVKSFRRFLIDNPLPHVTADSLPGPPTGPLPPCGFGAFHQQYWLDGHLVAVGVVDVLPSFVSSVYCFWDPDLAHLSLGVVCALQEIEWTRSLRAVRPQLRYYTLGYYIPGCPKMVYKADYRPSDLLCPITYSWAPHSRVAAALKPGNVSTLPLLAGAVEGQDPVDYNLSEAAKQGLGLTPSNQQLLATPLMLADFNGVAKGVVTFGQLYTSKSIAPQALKRLQRQLTRWHREAGPQAARTCAVFCQMSSLIRGDDDDDEADDDS